MKTEKVYSLPLRPEDFEVAHSDPRAHKPGRKLEHAVDFPLPEGTPILAAADGEVVYVYAESNEGGLDDKYRNNINKYTNWIRIKHGENEFSEYAHLRYNGSVVFVGDMVKRGDVIGYSGNTGLSTRPHLHFHVMHIIYPDGKRDWETLEIRWDKPFTIFGRSNTFLGLVFKFFYFLRHRSGENL